MEALYKAYRNNDKVAMYLIYVNEAHPTKKAGTDPGAKGHEGIGRHQTIDDKVLAASRCMDGLKLTLPVLIDHLDGAAERAYRGRPAATAVIGLDGKLVFYSRGPNGAQPQKADAALLEILATLPD